MNIGETEAKLDRLLGDFRFAPAAEVLAGTGLLAQRESRNEARGGGRGPPELRQDRARSWPSCASIPYVDDTLVHTGQHYDAQMSEASSRTWRFPSPT